MRKTAVEVTPPPRTAALDARAAELVSHLGRLRARWRVRQWPRVHSADISTPAVEAPDTDSTEDPRLMEYARTVRQRSLRSSPPPANPARFDFPTIYKANQRQFMCEWMFCLYRLRTCRGIASRIIHSTPGQTVDRRRCHKQENGHYRKHCLSRRTGRSN